MVYAKLSVPIFEWGKRKNTRRIGKLDVNRALENQSKVADGVRLEVETAYYTYTQAVHQVCLTESSLTKAATSEQLAMDKYKEGTISIVEVLNAQMYHQEAELNHIRSKLRAQLAKSSLERVNIKHETRNEFREPVFVGRTAVCLHGMFFVLLFSALCRYSRAVTGQADDLSYVFGCHCVVLRSGTEHALH